MATIRSTRSALTLIEVLMVLAIMGILAAAVVPSTNGNSIEDVRAAGRVLVQDLAYARGLAVAYNSQYRVAFDTSANRYTITHVGANTSLNTLPANSLAGKGSSTTQQVTDFDDLNRIYSGGASLNTVLAGTATVTSVDFDVLGNTTRTTETVVWLRAGAGGTPWYVAVHINPVTGLATADAPSVTGPSGSSSSSSTGTSGTTGSGSSGSGGSTGTGEPGSGGTGPLDPGGASTGGGETPPLGP